MQDTAKRGTAKSGWACAHDVCLRSLGCVASGPEIHCCLLAQRQMAEGISTSGKAKRGTTSTSSSSARNSSSLAVIFISSSGLRAASGDSAAAILSSAASLSLSLHFLSHSTLLSLSSAEASPSRHAPPPTTPPFTKRQTPPDVQTRPPAVFFAKPSPSTLFALFGGNSRRALSCLSSRCSRPDSLMTRVPGFKLKDDGGLLAARQRRRSRVGAGICEIFGEEVPATRVVRE